MKQCNSLASARTGTQRGATLIEVLISIVIMAFGMLGLAGMQAATTQFRLGSDIRTSVNELTSDISDRLRGNMEKLPGYGLSNSSK